MNTEFHLGWRVQVCVAKSIVVNFELENSINIWKLELYTVFST